VILLGRFVGIAKIRLSLIRLSPAMVLAAQTGRCYWLGLLALSRLCFISRQRGTDTRLVLMARPLLVLRIEASPGRLEWLRFLSGCWHVVYSALLGVPQRLVGLIDCWHEHLDF